MNCNDEGTALIKGAEGLRLTAYQDPGGLWTIGRGHHDSTIHEGMTITEVQADQLFEKDLALVEKCINQSVSVPLTGGQFSALCSFIYEIGCDRFRDPVRCSVRVKLNMGRYDAALSAMMLWTKETINGKKVVLPGMVARRAAEKILFLKPDMP